MNFKLTSIFFILLLMAIADVARAWDIDWSHHTKVGSDDASASQTMGQTEASSDQSTTQAISDHPALPEADEQATNVDPAPVVPATADLKEAPQRPRKSLEGLVQRETRSHSTFADKQEFVILNTAHGFIPSNVRLHKGVRYTVHVVNVNEDKKNVSFMLDAFNQHYATYYGEIKSFTIDTDKVGVFEFECPETSTEGKLVVLGPNNMPPVNNAGRSLSSESNSEK